MSQGVNKLKELLFDSESRALVDLQHRVERVSKSEVQHRTEINARLDAVFSRSGTEERFRKSVAGILDGALRDAEIERHAALSDAIAPLVVRTIKTEITNSTDELAEALYPMTGRMVKAYVASAIKDLTNQINGSLERNPTMLRINSLMTGRSVAELALADAQALNVEEIYLIRRGSGELIARWPKNETSGNRDQVMSGILTAINEFAIEAFNSQGTALRQIDLGDSQVYLRGSPAYLLAAKCTGTAPAAVEQTIDREFLKTFEAHSEFAKDAGDENPSSVLAELADRLTGNITSYYENNAASGTKANPAKMLMWIFGLALAAWLGWTLFSTYLNQRTHAKATYVLDSTSEMAGYPTHFDTTAYGSVITVNGLAPSSRVKHSLISQLHAILPSTRINDQMTIVNSNFPDHRPELSGLQNKIDGLTSQLTELDTGVSGLQGNVAGLETGLTGVTTGLSGVKTGVTNVTTRLGTLDIRLARETIVRATTRASARLRTSLPDLKALSQNTDSAEKRSLIKEARTAIEAILPQIDTQRSAAKNSSNANADLAPLIPALNGLTARIDRAAQKISNAPSSTDEPTLKTAETTSLSAAAENLALTAEHFATLAAAANQVATIKPTPPYVPSAREHLAIWARANAVFFTKGTDFTSSKRARQKLRQLAQLANDADTLVRVVGFTDEKGPLAKNMILSRARAQKVRRILIANGLRANLLTTAGRYDTRELSQTVGEQSPNRRVEFELGFIGERSK